MEGEDHHNQNPVVSFFVNLFNSIKLPLPIPNHNKKTKNDNNNNEAVEADVVVSDDSEKGDRVTFPIQKQNVEPLKLELSAEEAEKSTNPVFLWQVYAVGGFFLLRWAWKRWNEAKTQKKKEKDDDEPTNPPNTCIPK